MFCEASVVILSGKQLFTITREVFELQCLFDVHIVADMQ